MKLFIIWVLLLWGEANQRGFFGPSVPLAPRQRLLVAFCVWEAWLYSLQLTWALARALIS